MSGTNVRVEEASCIGCGQCVKICPSQALEMVEGKSRAVGTLCIECGHCAGVCPARSIRVSSIVEEWWQPAQLEWDGQHLAPGVPILNSLVSVMASRRSSRNFLPDPVPRSVLVDLVRIGTMAPSGTNSQKWVFHILPDREAVKAAGTHVARFFWKLNRLSEKKLVRWFSRWFMKGDPLGAYFRDYYDAVESALTEWRAGGRDRLFWGAPAVIMVGSEPGASCPREDALLATQNILLAAHTAGFGTCLVGFVVEALNRDRTMGPALGIPRSHRIHSVIALGKAGDPYRRLTGRRVPSVTWLSPQPAPLPGA